MKLFQSLFVLVTASQFAVAAGSLTQKPNLFSCEGEGFKVNYTTSSITGQPTYSVTDEEHHVQINLANRKDIKNLATPMGNLVTATYIRLALADGPTLHYNLIVPMTEVKVGETLTFDTQLIKTSVLSLFRPHGVSLVSQRNEVVPLKCEAQFVNF